jgi:hypothetical protein
MQDATSNNVALGGREMLECQQQVMLLLSIEQVPPRAYVFAIVLPLSKAIV